MAAEQTAVAPAEPAPAACSCRVPADNPLNHDGVVARGSRTCWCLCHFPQVQPASAVAS